MAAHSRTGLGRSLSDGAMGATPDKIEVNPDGSIVPPKRKWKAKKKSNLETQFPSYIQVSVDC